MSRARLINLSCAVLGVLAIAVSLLMLERARLGVERTSLTVGQTPVTLYSTSDAAAPVPAPVVVVAHGFAGSRQLMEAYSLTLAHAGYSVVSFDFQGHGRHPDPMGGDVTQIDGTTARLVAQTRAVIDMARGLSGTGDDVAILGHSMASDVIIRAAIEDGNVSTVVGVSSFSGAVTDTTPAKLLTISGANEPRLRAEALRAVRLVADAQEGETATLGDILRRAAVAPYVGHIGVLYAPTALREARDWLDQSFGRSTDGPVAAIGPWILALLAGTVLLFRPLAARLPACASAPPTPSARRFVLAAIAPAIVTPAVAATLYIPFLPVLVADYLLVHLALLGILQLALLRPNLPSLSAPALALLLVWGLAVFGLLLDRYAASFMPTQGRLLIVALLALGAVPAMLADAALTQSGHAALWRRAVTRLAFFGSLIIPALIDPEGLGFILITFPVLLLFFAVHGLMGRWVAQRAGATTAGVGLGLILGWAIGVSFPLFAA